MTKTRTTITLPIELLKKTKIRAVENNLNLSSFIEKLLQLNLDYQFLMRKVQGEKETKKDLALINKLSGRFKLSIRESPQELKRIIDQQYEKEMLS